MFKKEVKEMKKFVFIFLLWWCCFSGEMNRLKVQKKFVVKDQLDVLMEKGKEVLEDKGKVVDKISDLEFEYVVILLELVFVVLLSDDYRFSYEEVNIVLIVLFIVGSEEDFILNVFVSI